LVLFRIFQPFYAQFISSGLGMLVNFKLQHDFVFQDKGMKKSHLFLLSTLGSVGGILIGSTLIQLMHGIALTMNHPIFNKFFVVGVVFVYNYLTKRVIFSYKK
jgi:putative flippase GtrA